MATASMLTVIETAGFFAPIVFIFFHILRQFLLIPVVFVCVAGGLLFGTVWGSMYSVIGLTGASMTFYLLSKTFPKMIQRFINMKLKWLGSSTNFSTGQIIILRMIPFINFSLISLCILEKTKTFQHYSKLSFFTHIPSALCFTILGTSIQALSPFLIVVILSSLLLLVYLFREKQSMIKWNDFFLSSKEKGGSS